MSPKLAISILFICLHGAFALNCIPSLLFRMSRTPSLDTTGLAGCEEQRENGLKPDYEDPIARDLEAEKASSASSTSGGSGNGGNGGNSGIHGGNSGSSNSGGNGSNDRGPTDINNIKNEIPGPNSNSNTNAGIKSNTKVGGNNAGSDASAKIATDQVGSALTNSVGNQVASKFGIPTKSGIAGGIVSNAGRKKRATWDLFMESLLQEEIQENL